MDPFLNIGVVGRPGPGVEDSLEHLVRFLQQRKMNVILAEPVAPLLSQSGLQTSSSRMIGEESDLIIVVGGDGSLLGAARELARHDVPVLGINRGRLGFLTDVSPDDIDRQVGDVLDGKFRMEKRFLLDAVVTRKGDVIGEADALNDVVVNSGTSAQMIEFDLFIEDEFVYRQRSDGLIISTPTGSTAYSLSAGGPIMHPALDAMVLVPMFPHTLSSRPIVVEGNSEIRLEICRSNQIHPPVTCDGQVNLTANPGDTVIIRKKPHRLKLIHPLGHSFYAGCRDKLGWNTKPGV